LYKDEKMDKKTKLSLLSDLIALARTSEGINDIEYNFLALVAKQLGITTTELDELSSKKGEKKIIQPEAQRILHFHRLVLLMNVDQYADNRELLIVKNFGLKMGLNQEAIDRVLKIMHNYPNKVVPPEVLIDIFKTQHN